MTEKDCGTILSLSFGHDEKKAFDGIFTRYYPKVKHFILGFCNDEFEAENIAQDIFMKLWIRRGDLASVGHLDSYMFAMARNATLNALKSSLRRKAAGETMADIADSLSVEDDVCCEELREIIERGIESMPPRQKRVFVMSRIDGMRNDEIAEKLQISKRTVEAHISSALADLRRLLPVVIADFIMQNIS